MAQKQDRISDDRRKIPAIRCGCITLVLAPVVLFFVGLVYGSIDFVVEGVAAAVGGLDTLFVLPFSVENALFPLLYVVAGGSLLGIFLSANDAFRGDTGRRWQYGGLAAVGLGGLCLLSAFGLTAPLNNDRLLQETLSPTGGTIDSVRIEASGTPVRVQVEQTVNRDLGWSFVTTEVRDASGTYLTSFGGEFWRYDEETETTYETTLRFPAAGTYALQFKTEMGTSLLGDNIDASDLSPIQVTLTSLRRWGAPHPLLAAAHLAFLFGTTLLVAVWNAQPPFPVRLRNHLYDNGPIRLKHRTWSVGDDDRTDDERVWYSAGPRQWAYDNRQVEEWDLTSPEADASRLLLRITDPETDDDDEDWFLAHRISADRVTSAESDTDPRPLLSYLNAHATFPERVAVDDDAYVLADTGYQDHGSGSSAPFCRYEWEKRGSSPFILARTDPEEEVLTAFLAFRKSIGHILIADEAEPRTTAQ